jgi:hypothetical protein
LSHLATFQIPGASQRICICVDLSGNEKSSKHLTSQLPL